MGDFFPSFLFDGGNDGSSGEVTRNTRIILDRVNDILDVLDTFEIDVEDDVVGILGDFNQDATGLLSGLVGGVSEQLGGLLGNADEGLTNLIFGIGDSLGDLIDDTGEVLGNVTESVGDTISGGIEAGTEAVTGFAGKAADFIQDAVQKAIDAIVGFLEPLIQDIRNFISGAFDQLIELGKKILAPILELIDDAGEFIENALGRLTDLIGDQIRNVTDFISDAIDKITNVGDQIFEAAADVLENVTQQIGQQVEEFFEPVSGVISQVREALDSLQNAVFSFIDEIGPVLQERVAEPLQQGFQFIAEQTNALVMRVVEGIDDAFESATVSMLTAFGLPASAAQRFNDMLSQAFPFNPIIQPLILAFLIFSMAQGIVRVPVEIASQRFGQDVALEAPFALEGQSDLQAATLRGLTSDGQAIEILQRQGFSNESAQRLLELRRTLPDIGLVQVWFLRNFISPDAALTKLRELGLNEDDAQNIINMSFFIPPVQDLITMAVREVFTPEIAERFGQFEDFPEQFREFARQQGINEEWARRYWAAHWALPSVQMGFQMLHRGVINEDELNVLLRSQDVMPFWRDKLTAISFSPLTRVDIRRMHDLGLIDEQDLVTRYMDIGYSRENAELMTAFTIEFNKDEGTEDVGELDRLNRSAVTRLFRAGAINRPTATLLLNQQGFGDVATQIFLQIEEIDRELEDREAQTALILEQSKAGVLTFAEAQDRLAGIGLEPEELNRALVKLERARASTINLPSRTDLDRMLKAELITSAEYLETLERLGFAPFWAERFLQLVRKG